MNRTTIRCRLPLLAILLVLCVDVDRAFATAFTWTGMGGVFRLFSDADNWKPTGGPPNGSNDSATFDGTQPGSDTFTVNFASSVTNSYLFKHNFGAVTLNLSGRTYTLTAPSGPFFTSLAVSSSDNDAALLLTSSTTLGTVNAVEAWAADHGSLTVTTNARLLLSGTMFVGGITFTGQLNVVNGGNVDSEDGQIDTGTAIVSDAGSLWHNDTELKIGESAAGTLIVQNRGRVESASGRLGINSGIDGDVTVTGAGSTFDNSSFLRVGESGMGALTISDGGAVENTNAQLGSNPGSRGTVTLSGIGSTWTSTDSVYVGGTSLDKGGTGTLTVGGSSTVNVGTSASEVLKVWETGRINLNSGTINTEDFDLAGIFNWTSGTLNVGDDATFRSGSAGSGLTIGPGKSLSVASETNIQPDVVLRLDGGTFSTGVLNNNGTLLLNSGTYSQTGSLAIGAGSTFGNDLTIGPGLSFHVNSTTNVAAGAHLAMTGGAFSSGGVLTNNGEIQLTHEFTTLTGGDLVNNALVLGRGRINKSLVNSATGVVRATGDQRLVFGGASNANSGRLELVGGTMEFASALNNAATGLISGRGALFFNGGLINQGKMQFSGGPTDIYGNVSFTGGAGGGEMINSGGANVVTFYGNVTHNGDEIRTSPTNTTVFFGDVTGAGPFTGTGAVRFEGTFAPGNSPATVEVEGDLQLGPASRLALELAGTNAGQQYDQLHVGGLLALDGTLDVSLLAGFAPRDGDRFDLIDFGSLVGRFDDVQLPDLNDGLVWDTAALYSTGTITAVPEPASILLALLGLACLFSLRSYKQ